MQKTIEPKKYANGRQAARYAELNYSTFRRIPLPYYKFGKVKLYKLSDIDQALEAFRVSPTSEILS